MGKAVFVTGTGTDVGKTYVTGLIVKKLQEAGVRAAYYKAAMSGNDRDENGKLIPGDAKWVKEISGMEQPLEETCPYIYETAVSPHLASRIEGNPVQLSVVQENYRKVLDRYEYVTVEGSGGILCPIDFDHEKLFLEDVIKGLNLDCILVADAGLGTINSVVLTCEYMKQKKITVKGILFNNWSGGIMQEDNLKMCETMTGIPVLAKIAKGDRDLDMDVELLKSLYA